MDSSIVNQSSAKSIERLLLMPTSKAPSSGRMRLFYAMILILLFLVLPIEGWMAGTCRFYDIHKLQMIQNPRDLNKSSSRESSTREASSRRSILTKFLIAGTANLQVFPIASPVTAADEASAGTINNNKNEESTINASAESVDSEEEARKREELKARLIERRKLMEAGRSSNRRQSYLDLSKQCAQLYNTTYQGLSSCPNNIPCL